MSSQRKATDTVTRRAHAIGWISLDPADGRAYRAEMTTVPATAGQADRLRQVLRRLVARGGRR